MTTPPRWLGGLAFATYLAAALGAGNLYPFSTFEMYGSTSLDSASRIVVREGDVVHEIERFSQWRCEAPPSADPRVCLASWPFFHMEAVDRAAIERVRSGAEPGDGAASVEVVRRIWRLSSASTPVVEDCVLARCEAAP